MHVAGLPGGSAPSPALQRGEPRAARGDPSRSRQPLQPPEQRRAVRGRGVTHFCPLHPACSHPRGQSVRREPAWPRPPGAPGGGQPRWPRSLCASHCLPRDPLQCGGQVCPAGCVLGRGPHGDGGAGGVRGPELGAPFSCTWGSPDGGAGASRRPWGVYLVKAAPWRSQLRGLSPPFSLLVLEAVWGLWREEPSLSRPLLSAVAAGPQAAGDLGLSGGRGPTLLGFCSSAAQEASLSQTGDVVSRTWPWVSCSPVPARAGHTGVFLDFGDQSSEALVTGNVHFKEALG